MMIPSLTSCFYSHYSVTDTLVKEQRDGMNLPVHAEIVYKRQNWIPLQKQTF